LMMLLPSPFDRLDAKAIPAEMRYLEQPKELVATWGLSPKQPVAEGEGMASIAISPDGRLVAAGAGKRGRLWEGDTGKELKSLDRPGPVAFSPDGKVLATHGPNSSVQLWETAGWKDAGIALKGNDAGIMAMSFAPDGKTLACGGYRPDVRLWNFVTK